jgi:hypothetical protein
MLYSYLLGPLSVHFPKGFPTKIMYASLNSFSLVTCPAHHSLLYFTIVLILGTCVSLKSLFIQSIHKRMVRFQKLIKNYFSPSTGTTYTVSGGNCPSFSYATSSSLLMLTAWPRGQFQRWRCSRKRLSVCSVLRCPDLWLQCSVSWRIVINAWETIGL